MRLCIAIAVLLSLLPAAAQAMRVRNGDNVPYNLTLQYLDERWEETLSAGDSITRPMAGIVVEFGEQKPFHTRADEEYLIYKGVMTLNRRNCCGRNRK